MGWGKYCGLYANYDCIIDESLKLKSLNKAIPRNEFDLIGDQ